MQQKSGQNLILYDPITFLKDTFLNDGLLGRI